MKRETSLEGLFDVGLSVMDIEYEHRMDISASVFKRMKELGLNKSELAQRLGVANSQVSRILSGERNLTLRTIASLECALDFRLDDGFRYHIDVLTDFEGLVLEVLPASVSRCANLSAEIDYSTQVTSTDGGVEAA